MPNLGTACAPAGVNCVYRCGPEGGVRCQGGVWVSSDGGQCPISSREVKRDIRYLGDQELAAVAADVEAIRLARYRYKDPVLGKREHLGFIIEDSPGIAAVDRDGRHVDLYGYASMLVATAQKQAQEIRALKKELAALKRGLARKRAGQP